MLLSDQGKLERETPCGRRRSDRGICSRNARMRHGLPDLGLRRPIGFCLAVRLLTRNRDGSRTLDDGMT